MDDVILTSDQVVRYVYLVARRLEILMGSGMSWQPEYDQELEEIDKEIAVLRRAVDAAHAAKSADPLPCPDELDFDAMQRQQLDFEVKQAIANGGRTDYLYDIDGNEYYTTVDGVRHYTRDEG